jgi:hypothetical protein
VIGKVVTAWLVWRCWRSVRADRRGARLRTHIERVHAEPASLEATLATFWLGRLFARYGSAAQLDDWYSIVHGPTWEAGA